MASVTQHYADHLGPIYEWMIGDFDAAIDAARMDLRAANLASGEGGVAVDLGAGLGAHAIALAEVGFRVIAIDSCVALVEALEKRVRARGHGQTASVAAALETACVQDDLQMFRRHCAGAVDAVVCMGDTLTHLPSRRAVARLLKSIATALAPGGTFVTTVRDYSIPLLEGNCRIVPVRQDDSRILACVLDYRTATVMVHDVVYERAGAEWTFRESSYAKLRLNPSWIQSELNRLGFIVNTGTTRHGMVHLTARRLDGDRKRE